MLFRNTSATPCRGCFRLFKNPDGTPRLYTRAELEAGEAMGVNRGGWRDYHLRLGPEHPACACSPWLQYHPAMQQMHEKSAPRYAEAMRRLKVFEEAA